MISLYSLLSNLSPKKYKAKLITYYKRNCLKKLEEKRVKIIYIKKGSRKSDKSQLKSEIKKTVVGYYLKKSTLNKLRRDITFFLVKILPSAIKYFKIIKKENPDLIHCNNGLKININMIIAAKLSGKKCICHERTISHFNLLEKSIGKSVDLFICNSNAVKKNYLEQGFSSKNIEIIHNGVDLNKFSKKRQKSNKNSNSSIISIGRLIKWKGHHIFIKAASKVLKINPSVRFIIVGSGNYETELKNLSKNLEISDSMIFTGYLKDVRRTLEESDIFVHCSTRPEPFGRTIIEAMAMEKPVIATNSGGVPEIITDGKDGILIPPKDPEIMAEKVILLLKNKKLRDKLGGAGRKKIKEKFDIKYNIMKTEKIYEEIFKN